MFGHNLRMTEWQAALLRAQLERLPAQHDRRARAAQALENAVAELPGLRRFPDDPRVTRRTYYQYILRYDRAALHDVPRDVFLHALQAEGIPCAGRFYVPLNEDPLLAMDPLTNPLARAGVDYSKARFPVARRAAYEEAVWLPHQLLLGDPQPLVAALTKIARNIGALRGDASHSPATGRQ